jgi:hypothetical protein
MKRICLIVCLGIGWPCLGQHVLIKVNGEAIPYKKIKFEDEYVEIVKEREKIKISENEVAAYFDDHYQTVFYKKPIVPDIVEGFKIFPDKRSRSLFEYVEREKVGIINIYKRIESSGSPGSASASGGMTAGTNTTTYYYYAEKGDVYKNVYVSGLLMDREKRIEALKPFVADDPEILQTLESEEFRLNEKNLFMLVREYNLRNFQKVAAMEYRSASNASFYTRARQKIKEKLTVTVNDSMTFKLPVSSIPLPIALPKNVPSKVCVTWEDGTFCTTISPCPYAVHYYELDYSVSNKSFEIEKRTLNEFKNYMISVLK